MAGIVSQSKVGLALSAKEGAMKAIIEYLYSGLPVVATAAQGGREVFLKAPFGVFVKPDKKTVSEAVYQLIEKNLDPYEIRTAALNMIEEHRQRFYDVVCQIYRKEGFSAPDYAEFAQKLWRNEKGIENCALRIEARKF